MSSGATGVLVMAYGGPESLDEIPGYLADIRHGRATPRAVVEDAKRSGLVARAIERTGARGVSVAP